jgi:hypothetical protein
MNGWISRASFIRSGGPWTDDLETPHTHETNADAQKRYERIAARSGFIQYRIVL